MIDFIPVAATIERIVPLIPEHRLFDFRLASGMDVPPGCFVELSVPGIGGFPVSTAAAGLEPDRFQACIRRAGRVTSALYRLAEGDGVSLRGPFGNGFPADEFLGRDVLLVAGGLGMAPLRGVLQSLLARRDEVGEILLLYGCREPEAILFREELEELAAAGKLRLRFSVDFATELPWAADSFICKVGLVTSLLEDLRFAPENTVAAVCGPPSLYSCVPEELASLGIAPQRILATLERRMKCGIGQCCHCVTGGVFVCRQGPVFSLEQLRGMENTI